MSRFRMVDIALMGALACSAGLNILQTQKIRSLTAAAPAPRVAVNRGTPVPPLVARTADGKNALIAPRDLPLVVYFFSQSCAWCERNAGSLNDLERQVRGRYRVVGVSLSKLNVDEYRLRHALTFPIYDRPDVDTLTPYGITGTPQTVVVSREGRIIESWTGAYTGAVKQSLERTLGVHLSGA